MSSTNDFIMVLQTLKAGDLGLLRTHANKGLDQTVDGFDLFTGLWWPLRQKNQFAPRREVAWLIAKLYAKCPIEHQSDCLFAHQLQRCEPREERARNRFRQKFDELITTPLEQIEPTLRRALQEISSHELKLDWVKLTDDLSFWEQETKHQEWINQYLSINERVQPC